MKIKRKRILSVLAVIGLAAAGATLFAALRAPSVNIASVDPVAKIVPSDRILIFAPHCDDETLAAGGLIQRAVAAKTPLKIVLITNGDNNIFSTDIEFKTLHANPAKYIRAGEQRQRESLAAAKSLGVPARDLVFLGYPDRGIKALYTTNWPSHHPYRARGTRATRAPYKLIYEPNALYSGENLLGGIRRIIADFSPTVVVAPHRNDHHPDHKYSEEFIAMALKEIYGPEKTEGVERPALLTYLIHFPHFPHPRGMMPDKHLLPPFAASLDMTWFSLALTEKEEENKKRAVMMSSSQIVVPELGRLMKSFVRKNELFEKVEF